MLQVIPIYIINKRLSHLVVFSLYIEMVRVTINDGVLEGELLDNEYGGQFYSFKGIPYAAAPIGDLRFKAPQPITPWSGIREAKTFGNKSYQIQPFYGSDPRGSEDCLYLNVYTPVLKPTELLPVMFYIHGGGFSYGSGHDDFGGPEFLIRHGVVIVTINYRLGPLGFLCLDTKDVPGNAGMKDQVAALKWANNNIDKFGGDPKNITIFGESAGGTSVSHHMISPMSKGLFKRAISQSGTINCPFGYAFQSRERALTFAKQLGFYSEDDKELYEFFKTLPVESFVGLKLENTSVELHNELSYVFLSVVSETQFRNDERFFYGDVFEALRNGIHEEVDVMVGYTEDEGYLALAGKNMQKIIYQMNNSADFYVPSHISLNCPLIKQIEISRKIKRFHHRVTKEITMADLNDFAKYCSMAFFVYDIVQWAKMCVKLRKNKVYFYIFTCKSERNLQGSIMGLKEIVGDRALVNHADDLFYIFPMKGVNQKVDLKSDTFKMIDNVTKLYTNFAKYGNPTPDSSLGVKWTPYSLEKQDYLDIGNKLTACSGPNKDEVEFYEDIYREYCPRCVFE